MGDRSGRLGFWREGRRCSRCCVSSRRKDRWPCFLDSSREGLQGADLVRQRFHFRGDQRHRIGNQRLRIGNLHRRNFVSESEFDDSWVNSGRRVLGPNGSFDFRCRRVRSPQRNFRRRRVLNPRGTVTPAGPHYSNQHREFSSHRFNFTPLDTGVVEWHPVGGRFPSIYNSASREDGRIWKMGESGSNGCLPGNFSGIAAKAHHFQNPFTTDSAGSELISKVYIESKIFTFCICQSNILSVSEFKKGVISSVNVDLGTALWIKESLADMIKLDWNSSKVNLEKTIKLSYGENDCGGYLRIQNIGGDSLFVPAGIHESGLKQFAAHLAKGLGRLKQFDKSPQLACPQPIIYSGVESSGCGACLDFEFDHTQPIINKDFSISMNLFLADINSLENWVQTSESNASSEDALKTFFQTSFSHGVDYLIREFEKILQAQLEKPINVDYTQDGDKRLESLPFFSASQGVLEGDSDSDSERGDFFHDHRIGRQNHYCHDDRDGFQGHASDNDQIMPFSSLHDLRDSKANKILCAKAQRATKDVIPFTTNLSKLRGAKKSHSMVTRSHSSSAL